jgi:bifunctional enzyme CysN/CysC
VGRELAAGAAPIVGREPAAGAAPIVGRELAPAVGAPPIVGREPAAGAAPIVGRELAPAAFDERVFRDIERELTAFLAGVGITPKLFVPVAARDGDNIATPSARSPWYRGPTVLGVLDQLERSRRPEKQPLRFFVQDVYRFDARRILAGRVESGALRVGDRVRFEPGARTAVVASIEQWPSPTQRADAIAAVGQAAGRPLPYETPAERAIAGDSIGITLTEQIFVERGHVASHAEDGASAPHVTRKIRARIFWMGKRPLELDQRVKLRVCTHEADVRLAAIERIVDASTLDAAQSRAFVQKDDVADIVLEARAPFPVDLLESALASSSRFVLVQGYDVAGGGLVLADLSDAQQRARNGAVSPEERASRNGHRGAVVQLHESDAALAADLERALFEHGVSAVLADAASATAFAHAGLIAVVGPGRAPGFHALAPRGDVRALLEDVLAHTRVSRTRSSP